MYSVLRALIVYFVLLLIFRIGGKRSVSQTTTFDFVLLLIISHTISNSLVGQDYSLINSFLLVMTLMLTNIAIDLWKQRSSQVKQLVDGVPLVILENGQPLKDRMNKARVRDEDILMMARELQGLERMDQIKYAVLESSGSISIIPK
jgi:uncharacterized membrane protein YcaP (DUF421 family)